MMMNREIKFINRSKKDILKEYNKYKELENKLYNEILNSGKNKYICNLYNTYYFFLVNNVRPQITLIFC